jgi:hypothetical protein
LVNIAFAFSLSTADGQVAALRQRTTPLGPTARRFCHSFGWEKTTTLGQYRQEVAIAENGSALQSAFVF